MLAADVIAAAERRVGETVCGKWHLDRVIGVGGMAAVYEATHRNRNRVAIKLLHPVLSLDEGTRHRFLREGYVANTIRHSGAVQVLDDDTTEDGAAFLVMELLRGESVEERMHRKGGALEVHEALSIVEQLLDVLEAAHDQNVIHRDIKPDNLFLTEEGKLKVLDFGIARLHQGNTRATKVGSFMGTPAFCAQEQARGRWDEVDHRTDLYSVGATLFTCVSGTHVHEAETPSEQLALAIGKRARSLREVMPNASSDLVELVDTSLAYDKEDRFQSARAMNAAVKRVLAGAKSEYRARSSFPAAETLGPGELDPDSVFPRTPWERSVLLRVLVGVFAAGVLAVVLLFFADASRADREEAPEGPDALPGSRQSQAVEPSQNRLSSSKAEQASQGRGSTEGSLSGAGSRSEAASLGTALSPGPAPSPANLGSPSKTALGSPEKREALPSKGSLPAEPAPASEARPAGEPPEGEEAMFDRRY